jgi:undecaprenyl-diphosphatase
VLAYFLNYLGSWYVTWPLRAGVAMWLGWRRRTEALLAWLLAIAVYEPLVHFLKEGFERPRPPDPAVAVTGFSFPSGHASVGAAIAIGLVIVLVPAGPRRRLLEVLAGAFAFVMAASRVYLDAHWMSDVVAGTAIGAAVMIGTAATVHEIGDQLHWRRIKKDANVLG